MPQPTDYEPETAFVGFEVNASWFPGHQLDAEFANLDITLNEILANLALIQRDDGAVANETIGWDQLQVPLRDTINLLTAGNADTINTILSRFAVISTDNAIVRFNGTAGGTQNTGVIVDDSNNIYIPGTINIGHVSDTTLARVSPGVLSVAGVVIARFADHLGNFAATTSAQLKSVISDETGSGALVFANTPALITPAIGAATGTSLVMTGASASILAAGRQGNTDPVFKVDASAATVVTGIVVTGAASGGRAFLAAISSAANEGLSIDAKGSGTIRLGNTSTGDIEAIRNVVLPNTIALQGKNSIGAALNLIQRTGTDVVLVGDSTPTNNELRLHGGSTGGFVTMYAAGTQLVRLDNTNGFQIGDAAAPGAAFSVSTSASFPGSDWTAWFRHAGTAANNESLIRHQHFSNTQVPQPILTGIAARGTVASPTTLSSGDYLLILEGRGYDGSATNHGEYAAGFSDTSAQISFRATQTWSGTAHGSQITFSTTPNGATSSVVALTIGQDASLTFGAANAASIALTGSATPITFTSLTSGSATVSGHCQKNANDSERVVWKSQRSNAGGAIANGTWISTFDFFGHDGSAFFGAANMACIADGAVSAGVVPLSLLFQTGTNNSPVTRLTLSSAGNVSTRNSALATNATDGFLYIPTCAGTPTGTPTALTGVTPIIVNTTNNKLYFYSTGAWRDAGP